jgi:hypothetical protein
MPPRAAASQLTDLDAALADDAASFYADPLGWTLYAYDWGQGDLEGFEGPDAWQRDFLTWIGECVASRGFDGSKAVDPIRRAVSSGHGVGKSALTAWIVGWIMSTRPHCKGVVTANTAPQLESKTWAEIAKWNKRSIFGRWFDVSTGRGSMRMTAKASPESWRVDAQTCREENSEAFAGLHAATSTPFYIFDEASAVPAPIWEVAEGGMTDGEPMIFVFGNPTRNSGKFHECFTRQRHRWSPLRVDSRLSAITNKAQIAEWLADYGEDSDFFRVRVRGEFPRAGSMQYLSSEDIALARRRSVVISPATPKVIGVDVARFGDDQSVIARRHGRKAEKLDKYRGLDTMELASIVAHVIITERPDAVFVDGVGIGAGVVDRLRQLGHTVFDVQAGASPSKPYADRCTNRRAEMWLKMREWLPTADIPDTEHDLADELASVEYAFDARGRVQLEKKESMKRRGLPSPDCADALALTFAEDLPASFDDGAFTASLLPDWYEDI